MGNNLIVGLIGFEEFFIVFVIGGFFEIFNVLGISGLMMSLELSLNLNNFYWMVLFDIFWVKVMVDVIEYFNWSYVVVVGIYDLYGWSGVWGLVEEVGRCNNFFCIVMIEFIISDFLCINGVVIKLRWCENIKVVVLWIYGVV